MITDDNQMLAYGRVRAHSRRYGGPKGTARRNLKRLARIESAVRE